MRSRSDGLRTGHRHANTWEAVAREPSPKTIANGENMILQSTTPDTFAFMVLGYAVILGTMALYILSIFLRDRRIDHETRLVEALETEEQNKQDR